MTKREGTVRRGVMVAVVAVMTAVGAASVGGTTQAKVAGPNGRIAFSRFERSVGDLVNYTVNPDGSLEKRLFPGVSGWPHWSPDGTEISFACCDDGMAAHIINPDTGSLRILARPDPTLFTDCGVWSADGARLACDSGSEIDPSRNGIYSIRSFDGGGLTRITSNPGGEDVPGDYSPDGRRILFDRITADGSEALYTVLVNGGGLKRISPATFTGFQVGSWSPLGDQIVFAARSAPDQRRSIWVVDPNGRGLHEVSVQPSCGGAFSDRTSRGCQDPSWSPDGMKIVLDIFVAATNQRNIYTMNADGTGLFQITHHGPEVIGEGDEFPDWGPHASAT
jgi:Tol biopolymer transport system component